MNDYAWESLARGATQGSIALLAVWATCRIFARLPAWVKCWLWRLAWLRVLFALAAPFALNLRVLPAPEPIVLSREQVILAPATPPESPAATTMIDRAFDWKRVALYVWAVGAAAGLARLALQWLAARRLRIGAENERATALLSEASEKIAIAPPRLVISQRVSRPLLVGVWRPMIVLPSCAAEMPADRLDLIFRHELAHLKRHDLLWNWLPAISQIALWFNPLVWLAGREYSLAQEMACDEMAIGRDLTKAPALAATLVALASNARAERTSPLLTASVIRSTNTLERRLKSMKTIHLNRSGGAVAFAVLLMLLAPALLPWQISAQKPEPDSSAVPTDDGLPDEKEILQQRIKIAQTQLEAVENQRKNGVGGTEAVIGRRRELLHLEQEAAMAAGDAGKVRELIRAELKLVQQLQNEAGKKQEVGLMSPSEKLALDQEALGLMLKIKRAEPAPGMYPAMSGRPSNPTAVAKAYSRRDIVARREGPITELKIKRGQKVKAGDTLMVINEPEAMVRVRIAESQYKIAQTTFELKKLEIQNLAKQMEKTQVDKEYIARKSELDIRRAEGELELMQQQLEQSKLDFQKNFVRAPVDGVIESVSAALNSEVPPGGVVATILVED